LPARHSQSCILPALLCLLCIILYWVHLGMFYYLSPPALPLFCCISPSVCHFSAALYLYVFPSIAVGILTGPAFSAFYHGVAVLPEQCYMHYYRLCLWEVGGMGCLLLPSAGDY
jgi:hypothetical protein